MPEDEEAELKLIKLVGVFGVGEGCIRNVVLEEHEDVGERLLQLRKWHRDVATPNAARPNRIVLRVVQTLDETIQQLVPKLMCVNEYLNFAR